MIDLNTHLQSKIPQICQAAKIEPAQDVVQLLSGVVNPAFCVNDKYILRFNVRDLDIRKFKREQMAFELLAGTGAPVPKVIWLDESRSILNADILITERLLGQSISNYWQDLSGPSRTLLCKAAAGILASIHAMKVPSFGPLDPDSKKYTSWNEYLGDCLQETCRKVSAARIFEDHGEIEKKVWTAFKKVQPQLNSITEPRLLHGDFHFANLIGRESEISGVVDFEWSIGGDPDMDFRNPTNIHDSANDSEPALLAAYEKLSQRQFSPQKMDFYRMLIKLELMPVSLNHWVGKVPWGEANHRQIMKTFEQTLGRLLAENGP